MNRAMTEQEWRDRYKARLKAKGLDADYCADAAKNTEVDLDEIPEESADAEFVYMREG